jgi:hypothetical protein
MITVYFDHLKPEKRFLKAKESTAGVSNDNVIHSSNDLRPTEWNG